MNLNMNLVDYVDFLIEVRRIFLLYDYVNILCTQIVFL